MYLPADLNIPAVTPQPYDFSSSRKNLVARLHLPDGHWHQANKVIYDEYI